MFNIDRIEALERRVRTLEEDEVLQNQSREGLLESHKRNQLEIWSLRADLERLTKHLGLEFKDVNERQLVAVDKLKK